MNTVRLECTTGGHNKYYEFHGIESKGRYTVKGLLWSNRSGTERAIIYDGDNKSEANKEFEKKKTKQLKKGYVLVSQNGKASPAPAEKKTTLIFQ